MSEQPNQFEEAEAPLYPREPTPPPPLSPEVKAKADQLQRELVAAIKPPMTAPADVEALVERLRHPGCVDANCVKCRAADLLESQAAEIARLTEEVKWRRIGDHDVLEDEVVKLREHLEGINRILSPGTRTFDELLRDVGYATDRARAALGDTPAGPTGAAI